MFQVERTAPATPRVRLLPAAGAEPERVWRAVREEPTRRLAEQGLGNVTVRCADTPPRRTPGGTYRTVIPLAGA
ncbi:hypothetical protein IPZ68_12500 [Streptomyces arenae]|nr:hypothetical protein [Streptomyces arenae]